MSREVVELLSASLQTHAAVEVDTGRLLARATARGDQLVRRRYAGFAVCACALLTVAMLVPSVVSRGAPMVPGSPQDLAQQTIAVQAPYLTVVAEGHVPAMPKAAAKLGAASRPDLVGKDAAVLHFAVEGIGAARSVTWATGADLEIMQIERAPDKYSWVTLASNAKVLDLEIRQRTGAFADSGTDQNVEVAGRPGVLRTIPTGEGVSYLLRWEPVVGLVANVHVRAGDEHELWNLVDRVRLNEATRCVVPFGLSKLPPDVRLLGCRVSLRGYEDVSGMGVKWLRLVDAELSLGTSEDRVRVGLYADPKRMGVSPPRPSATGGHDSGVVVVNSPYPGERMELTSNDGPQLQLHVDGAHRQISGRLVSSVVVMGSDLNNPDTWPEPLR